MVYCGEILEFFSQSFLLCALHVHGGLSLAGGSSVSLEEHEIRRSVEGKFYFKQDVFGTWKAPDAFLW